MHRYQQFISNNDTNNFKNTENNSSTSSTSSTSSHESFGLPSLLDDSLVIFRSGGRYAVKKLLRQSSPTASSSQSNSNSQHLNPSSSLSSLSYQEISK